MKNYKKTLVAFASKPLKLMAIYIAKTFRVWSRYQESKAKTQAKTGLDLSTRPQTRHAIQNAILSGTVILLVALGWYFVLRQTQTLTQTTIVAYQQTELEIVRAVARSVENYVASQVELRGRTDVTEFEQEIFKQFVAPVRLLENGDAWIYAPDHIVFDLSSDLPDEYWGQSMAEIFALQVEHGASHYEVMTEAVMNARQGVGWYIWLPDKGKEIAAWTPAHAGQFTWTIGLSTPLPEILESTGAAGQIRASITGMSLVTVLALGLLLAWAHSAIKRDQTEKELQRAHDELELRVEERTAELSRANASLKEQVIERKRAEERLAEERNLLRTLINNLPDYIYVKDVENRFLLVNEAVRRHLGAATVDEVVGKTDFDFSPFELAEQYYANEQALLQSGQPLIGHEEPILDQETGTRKCVLSTKVPFRNSQGQIVGLVGMNRDITELKRAEEALKQSEQDYRGLFENAHDALIIFTPEDEIILSVNQRACEMYGFDRSEFIGLSLETISKDVSGGKLKIKEVLAKGGNYFHVETVQYRKGGAEIFLEVNAAVVDYKGQQAIMSINRDITERMQVEKELGKYRDQLEDLVIERTTALMQTNEQLQRALGDRRQAERQIKASLAEKEVLLKEIHHRVKNNLQIVSSLLNLQAGYIQDEEALAMFRESQHRVKSMALVHEILYQAQDLARIDFAEYIRDLTTYLFQSYGVNASLVKLKLNIDAVSLGIDTAIPCGSIINELVSNSLKYAFPGGQSGQISIALRLAADHQLVLIVGDNGPGFPDDLDFRKTKSLGLKLVNTLVRQLKGTIELERSEGAEFKIVFVVS